MHLNRRAQEEIKRALRGSMPSWKATRLRVLLAVDQGMGTTQAAAHVGCGTATVKRVKARYQRGGYAAVLFDGRRQGGRPRKTTTEEEKQLTALACTGPPGDAERWTIRLLAKHCSADISVATVQRILARDGIQP